MKSQHPNSEIIIKVLCSLVLTYPVGPWTMWAWTAQWHLYVDFFFNPVNIELAFCFLGFCIIGFNQLWIKNSIFSLWLGVHRRGEPTVCIIQNDFGISDVSLKLKRSKGWVWREGDYSLQVEEVCTLSWHQRFLVIWPLLTSVTHFPPSGTLNAVAILYYFSFFSSRSFLITSLFWNNFSFTEKLQGQYILPLMLTSFITMASLSNPRP